MHSPIQIDRPFPTRDEASICQGYDRLLYPIWGDDLQLKAFLWMLARATAGHCEDKVWSVVMGERNSGKSIIGRLLKTALGPYVATIVPENLLVTQGKSIGADEAVKRIWMYLMQFSRLTITNEFRKLPGLKVDGNIDYDGYFMVVGRPLGDRYLSSVPRKLIPPKEGPPDCRKVLYAWGHRDEYAVSISRMNAVRHSSEQQVV
jgi:hypothetical protein